ncbi:aldo/keto reductase-like protein [Glonium stellatum]|uniref:Aldo/keto reductase-like protein n=1 Tax=Glonium stellatum TaxID=574774 RepID=A0A8E2JU63_9PEZI|nr:aldo/keto reductase-like protein [Glonium stellatum]
MSSIPLHPLGKNGPLIPAMGFGCMGLSAYYTSNPAPDEERFAVLDRAAELGETFWITSDVYNDSEDLLGKWFARTNLRSRILLATKFGYEDQGAGAYPALRSDPEFVKAACAKSLKRLGILKIDLYLAHRMDGKTPIEKTVQAMAELKQEGKIDYLGLSEVSAATLRRAHAVHPISAIEVEYSPFALDIESEQINLLKTCRELGVAVIAYSPLGRGMLTGAYKSPDNLDANDMRRLLPRFSPENFPKNLKMVEEFSAFAEKKGCKPGQLALAWLMAQGDDIFPIPGTTKVKYLEENIGAVNIYLTDAEIGALRGIIEATEIHGMRYPEGFTAETFRDTPPLILD